MPLYIAWAIVRRLKLNKQAIWLAEHIPHKALDISNLTSEDLVKDLAKFSPQKKTNCIAPVFDNHKKYDLDIIVPVYRTEKTIRKCLDSVLQQETKYAIRVICVDDGSPDDSGAILDEYAKCDQRVVVLHQQNRGLSGARNSGLAIVNAKYIFFLDSDDYLSENAVDELLDAAYEYDADITLSGYQRVDGYGNVLRTVQHPAELQIGQIETLGFVWGTIWKSELFDGIRFPEGYWFEDGLNWVILARKARSCYWSDMIGYNYLVNSEGITSNARHSTKVVDTVLVFDQLLKDSKLLDLSENWEEQEWNDFFKHVLCSERRLRYQSTKIQREAFAFFCFVFDKHFKHEMQDSILNQRLKKAFMMRSEWLYHVYCELGVY